MLDFWKYTQKTMDKQGKLYASLDSVNEDHAGRPITNIRRAGATIFAGDLPSGDFWLFLNQEG